MKSTCVAAASSIQLPMSTCVAAVSSIQLPMSTRESRPDFQARISTASSSPKVHSLKFWQMRLGKRRLLDYNKIWELLVPSETGYKKFLTWAEYDNQIVKDLLSQDVPGSSVSLSTPSRDSFLQEIIWVLETRQILFQSMMSLVTHSFGEKVYASTTKQAFRPHDVEKIKTIQAVYDTTRLNIKNLQQCLGPEASNAMISPTVLGKVSTDSILELAIQCILNTINPDTDIRAYSNQNTRFRNN